MSNVVQSILENEGFRSKPYPDPLSGGEPFTFGHGLTYITEDESAAIVKGRVKQLGDRLQSNIHYFKELPIQAREVLIEMAFQMGVTGTLKFRNMWDALSNSNFKVASKEMLDSRWAKQTPQRAKELAELMRECL